jgi:hypothetical protein
MFAKRLGLGLVVTALAACGGSSGGGDGSTVIPDDAGAGGTSGSGSGGGSAGGSAGGAQGGGNGGAPGSGTGGTPGGGSGGTSGGTGGMPGDGGAPGGGGAPGAGGMPGTGGMPQPGSPLCGDYRDAPEHRLRENTVEVGPGDDWISAIQDAGPGTEVLLLDGEYRLNGTYAVGINTGVTVRGKSGDRDAVVIRGDGYGPGGEGLMVRGADVSIAHLSVTDIRNHAISIKTELGATTTHIYDVHLFDIGTQHIKLAPGGHREGLIACSSIGYTEGGVQGSYINAIDLHQAIDWVIRDNFIYNIFGDGSGCEVDIDCGTYQPEGGAAILLWSRSSGTIVERNVIVDSWQGIQVGLTRDRNHIGGVFRNNFIYRERPGDGGILVWFSNDATVTHNTVLVEGYPGGIELRSAGSARVFNNLVGTPIFMREDNPNTQMGGNIDDASNNDLMHARDPHLKPGSRAIGAGVPEGATEVDIDGQPRTGALDVGADQYSE